MDAFHFATCSVSRSFTAGSANAPFVFFHPFFVDVKGTKIQLGSKHTVFFGRKMAEKIHGKFHLPNIDVQGRVVSFREGIHCFDSVIFALQEISTNLVFPKVQREEFKTKKKHARFYTQAIAHFLWHLWLNHHFLSFT